jgi:hypothetical protein
VVPLPGVRLGVSGIVVGGDADGERRSLGFSPTRPVPESEHPIAMPATSASTLKLETSVFIESLLGRELALANP